MLVAETQFTSCPLTIRKKIALFLGGEGGALILIFPKIPLTEFTIDVNITNN